MPHIFQLLFVVCFFFLQHQLLPNVSVVIQVPHTLQSPRDQNLLPTNRKWWWDCTTRFATLSASSQSSLKSSCSLTPQFSRCDLTSSSVSPLNHGLMSLFFLLALLFLTALFPQCFRCRTSELRLFLWRMSMNCSYVPSL